MITTYEQISSEIDLFREGLNADQIDTQLQMLGFTNLAEPKDREENDMVYLSHLFNKPIVTNRFIGQIVRKYNLEMGTFSRFIGDIPRQNKIDIKGFYENVFNSKLNYGYQSTNGYHVSMKNHTQFVVAPSEMFKKRIPAVDDPIVIHRISQFIQGHVRETKYNVIITAWGKEHYIMESERNQN